MVEHTAPGCLLCVFIAAWMVGCGGGNDNKLPVVDSNGGIGKQVAYSVPPVPADFLAGLPKNEKTGNSVVIEVQGLSLEYDATKKDQLTAIASCTGWIAACFKPGEREIDDCARSVPTCKTATPWLETEPCCPSACFERYQAARLAGRPSALAVIDNYVKDKACFPPDTPKK